MPRLHSIKTLTRRLINGSHPFLSTMGSVQISEQPDSVLVRSLGRADVERANEKMGMNEVSLCEARWFYYAAPV